MYSFQNLKSKFSAMSTNDIAEEFAKVFDRLSILNTIPTDKLTNRQCLEWTELCNAFEFLGIYLAIMYCNDHLTQSRQYFRMTAFRRELDK